MCNFQIDSTNQLDTINRNYIHFNNLPTRHNSQMKLKKLMLMENEDKWNDNIFINFELKYNN